MHISSCFFFLSDTATTQIYTLSLHDALPISDIHRQVEHLRRDRPGQFAVAVALPPIAVINRDRVGAGQRDRKSTRLNSSHTVISYAVFCLKKKKSITHPHTFSPKYK